MSRKKQVATDREWLVAVITAAVLLPAGFFFLWHAFDDWPKALMCTSIGAAGIQTEWERRFAAPNRNVRPRVHRCRR